MKVKEQNMQCLFTFCSDWKFAALIIGIKAANSTFFLSLVSLRQGVSRCFQHWLEQVPSRLVWSRTKFVITIAAVVNVSILWMISISLFTEHSFFTRFSCSGGLLMWWKRYYSTRRTYIDWVVSSLETFCIENSILFALLYYFVIKNWMPQK